MLNIYNLIALVLAYLVGSIPSALWVGRLFFGVDVREHGSKNAGATNTFRVLGKRAGFPVLFMDIFKGWAAVTLLTVFCEFGHGSNQLVNFQLAVGMAAVFGHIYPIYAKFRGGKGVATLLGIIFAIHPEAAGIAFGIFLITFLISKYVSLGAIVAAVIFPFIVIFIFKSQDTPTLIYFSIVMSLLVIYTHRANIDRLLKKEENKMKVSINFRRNNK
ncbi:MAG: glycerol-3-phosphate 1-O-acyltransferase PlsY [Crocinitomicaceae bacterium]|nr:glycerol-3-phosphate 1-O-acyltransferase PlsY [Crocinitomicaceae bacterium]MBT6513896.1 glycerol-3-phosphate 1-O-acyltransferase PlsY [Crocinitomicaceae bacterium]